MDQNEKEQNDYRITYYNAVSSKEVDWLWYPYIPYGKITILQGDPGEGKSTMMMQHLLQLEKLCQMEAEIKYRET